jgi:hypothetical protein
MRFLKEKDTRTHHRTTRHKKWNKKSVFTIVDKETVLNYINIIRTDGPVYLKQIDELNNIARKHHLHVLVGLVETKN